MAAYCDFNEIYGGKVVPYHLQGMTTDSYHSVIQDFNEIGGKVVPPTPVIIVSSRQNPKFLIPSQKFSSPGF